MERQGDEVHIETDEARGASSPNIVRWILAISLFAAIALLSLIWITGAATRGEPETSAAERARALSDYGGQGGVLASDADQATTPEATTTATEAAASPAPQN